VARLE
jgi:cAMP-dependent protein kinase regulator